MPVGSSGRIVVEIDPELKHDLYAALAREGSTMKQWLIENARLFIRDSVQLSLPLGENQTPARNARESVTADSVNIRHSGNSNKNNMEDQ